MKDEFVEIMCEFWTSAWVVLATRARGVKNMPPPNVIEEFGSKSMRTVKLKMAAVFDNYDTTGSGRWGSRKFLM